MKKAILAVVCGLSLLVVAEGCKKKENQPAPKPAVESNQQLPPGHSPAPGTKEGMTMPRGEITVNLPDFLKGKWKAVVLIVEERDTKKKSELTVSLRSDIKIPNSNLKVSVGEFIPDFKIDGLTITSMSNDLNNPAVGVKVFENDKEIFKGWLYSKFPNIHPFNHPKYSITLKEGLKKG